MALPGVSIIFQSGGLGRRNPTGDDCAAMIGNGVSPGSSPLLQLGTSYLLKSTDDAETIGIDAAYDTANDVLVFHHISEFFRKNPNGSLWLMLVAQTVTLTQMADKANQYAYKLINDSFEVSGETPARRLGIFRAPATGYSPTTTDGMDADVFTAVAKAKELMTQLDSEKAWLGSIGIEGRAFTGTATNADSLRALEKGGIYVVIGQDGDIAAIDALHASYAAIGTFLGDRSRAKVNESTAWPEKFNLQDEGLTKFIDLRLSSNVAIGSYSVTDQTTLHGKGYIFAKRHRGLSGAYWSSNPSCDLEASDFAWITDRETVAKAARLVYIALLPKVESPVLVEAATGKLDPGFVTYLESVGSGALAEMDTAEEISGKDVYIDPNQNIITTGKLVIKFKVVPTGTAREIEAYISLATSLA